VLHTALAVGAGLVATAFGLSTYERWLAGGRTARHLLAWTVALACFAVASFALAFGAAHGWSDVSFRTFYLFGAILNVPFLALGTVYLLGGQRKGDVAAAVVVVVCAFATGVVTVAPLTAPIPPDRLVQGSEVFGPLPRVLAAVCSAVPAVVIFAGAAWSAVRFRRDARRVWSNALIALGTVVLSSSGLLNSVLGEMDAFAVTLTAGVTILFGGFLVATATSGEPAGAASRPARAAAPRRT
jgi:hypothetical protein